MLADPKGPAEVGKLVGEMEWEGGQNGDNRMGRSEQGVDLKAAVAPES